jgi:F-type H+-transporting ATPase subunit a
MEKLEHSLWIVEVVNAIFGPLVAALLAPLGFTFPDPAKVIPPYIVMCALLVVFFAVLGLFLRSRLSVENPGKLQIVMETLVGAVLQLMKDNIGPTAPRYFGLVAGIGLFIFTANLIGKIPGFMSPTASINTTLGCALTVWLYYHYQGVRAQGLGSYLLHFAAPPGAPLLMAPIMLPIEIISHLSRVMSLSLRLFGNVFGEEMVVLIIASIVPLFAPLPMKLLGVITGSLQAFIFMLLTIIYLAGAVHVEHEDHGREHAGDEGHESSHAHAAA